MLRDSPATRDATRTEAGVARAFADFLKATFVYPENNVRVQNPLTEFLGEVLALGQHGLRLLFLDEHVQVNEGRAPYAAANLTWAKEAFERALLHGIELESSVTRPALLAFARRLAETGLRRTRGATFAKLWAETGAHPGIVPLALRYADESPREGMDLRSRQGRMLIELLEADPSVRAILDRVHERLQATSHPGEEARELHLLSTVLDSMPVEVLLDQKQVVKTVETVLQAVEQTMQEHGAIRPSEEDRLAARLLQDVGRRLFALQQGSVPADLLARNQRQGDGPGHPGDELYDEDPDALERELAKMLDHPGLKIAKESVLPPLDSLGATLALLTASESPTAMAKLAQLAAESLAKAQDAELETLRAYLEPLMAEGERPRGFDRLAALVSALRAKEALQVLVRTGMVTGITVRRTFPHLLGTFFDTLKASRPPDMAQVIELCRAIGPQPIRNAAKALVNDQGLLAPDRLAKVLATRNVATLPLLEVALENGQTNLVPQVVAFVRALQPTDPEAAAALIVDPPDKLPAEYLAELLRGLPTGRHGAAVRERSAFLLRNYVREIGGDPARLAQRVKAIRALADFPGVQTVRFLETLLEGRGLLRWRREPREIRDAARQTLAVLNAGGGNG